MRNSSLKQITFSHLLPLFDFPAIPEDSSTVPSTLLMCFDHVRVSRESSCLWQCFWWSKGSPLFVFSFSVAAITPNIPPFWTRAMVAQATRCLARSMGPSSIRMESLPTSFPPPRFTLSTKSCLNFSLSAASLHLRSASIAESAKRQFTNSNGTPPISRCPRVIFVPFPFFFPSTRPTIVFSSTAFFVGIPGSMCLHFLGGEVTVPLATFFVFSPSPSARCG